MNHPAPAPQGFGGIKNDDRVLVLGAGGWLGRTFLDLCRDVPDKQVLAIAANERSEAINGRLWRISSWSEQLVAIFEPTVVVNFAFLTRERQMEPNYEHVNRQLTDRFIWAMQLPKVRCAITHSSGAAVTDPDSPYGKLKSAEERLARQSVRPEQSLMIGRIFSLSGAFVRRPRDYAFSDFVLQAARGHVHIGAEQPVFRRYTDASDFLSVLTNHALQGRSELIESGGAMVEMQELAEEIVDVVNPDARISRSAARSDEPLTYASDNHSWAHACDRLAFTPRNLAEQIALTARGLLR